MFDVLLERFAYEYQQWNELSQGNGVELNGDKSQCRTGHETEPRTVGRVIFSHDTTLDMHAVSDFSEINQLCERP